MTFSLQNEFSEIFSFGQDQGLNWSNIKEANANTKKQVEKVISASRSLGIPLATEDTDLVVFGSLARLECTSKSDADWTMLIDGPSDPNHYQMALFLKDLMIKTELAEPGNSGMFGQITSSHSLIHNVGGQDDTNHNLSRRILLLLESEKISSPNEVSNSGTAYERTLRGVIHQYILNDSGFFGSSGKENVPRFLLNDIIRFWRTMCVDFAFKQKQQSEKKWALRNIKLRMSRKVIFIKGLLLCSENFLDEQMSREDLENNILKSVQVPALKIIFDQLYRYQQYRNDLVKFYSAYNDFLGLLNDEKSREELEELSMKGAYGSSIFNKAKEISHNFRDAIFNIFFSIEGPLRSFTLKYGVF